MAAKSLKQKQKDEKGAETIINQKIDEILTHPCTGNERRMNHSRGKDTESERIMGVNERQKCISNGALI